MRALKEGLVQPANTFQPHVLKHSIDQWLPATPLDHTRFHTAHIRILQLFHSQHRCWTQQSPAVQATGSPNGRNVFPVFWLHHCVLFCSTAPVHSSGFVTPSRLPVPHYRKDNHQIHDTQEINKLCRHRSQTFTILPSVTPINFYRLVIIWPLFLVFIDVQEISMVANRHGSNVQSNDVAGLKLFIEKNSDKVNSYDAWLSLVRWRNEMRTREIPDHKPLAGLSDFPNMLITLQKHLRSRRQCDV